MVTDAPSENVSLDRLYRLMILLSILGFSIAALGLVGELLGWWNDIGEWSMAVGTLLGVLTAVIAVMIGSTRGQARRIADAVLDNNGKLDQANGKLDQANGKLDRTNEQLFHIDGKLDQLDRLEKLDTLDVIQVHLDQQTGVMDRQVQLLTAIRDRL